MKSWNDCVREDLDAMGLTCHWWRKCSDRERWKGTIEKLLRRTWPSQAGKVCNNNKKKKKNSHCPPDSHVHITLVPLMKLEGVVI